MKAEPHSTDRAAAKKRKGRTERDLIAREAACHLNFAQVAGWLVRRSIDALQGKEETPPPDDMWWLLFLRVRAEAEIEADDEAADGDTLDRDEDPQVSELWRLLRCLTLLEKRMYQRTEDLTDQAAMSTRSGRRRKIVNALARPMTLRDLAGIGAPKQKGKPGRKRKLPITSEDLLAEFGPEPRRIGKPERDRLAELVRQRIPDVRRSTGRSPEQHAVTLAKRLAEARREFRNQGGNAGHSAAANPNGSGGTVSPSKPPTP